MFKADSATDHGQIIQRSDRKLSGLEILERPYFAYQQRRRVLIERSISKVEECLDSRPDP